MKRLRLALLILVAALSTGCGTKGDLVLPEPEAAPVQPAKSPADAPAEAPTP
jgi:predicted small lipoprotein YifL